MNALVLGALRVGARFAPFGVANYFTHLAGDQQVVVSGENRHGNEIVIHLHVREGRGWVDHQITLDTELRRFRLDDTSIWLFEDQSKLNRFLRLGLLIVPARLSTTALLLLMNFLMGKVDEHKGIPRHARVVLDQIRPRISAEAGSILSDALKAYFLEQRADEGLSFADAKLLLAACVRTRSFVPTRDRAVAHYTYTWTVEGQRMVAKSKAVPDGTDPTVIWVLGKPFEGAQARELIGTYQVDSQSGEGPPSEAS